MIYSLKLEEYVTVVSHAIVFEEVLRVVCAYASQSAKSMEDYFFH